MKNLSTYSQYKNDTFNKMKFNFESGKSILDVGCGDGSDAEIFINEYGLDVYGIDVYEHKNIKSINRFKFKQVGIYKIPFEENSFDYIFLHDVLHHIDEENQSYENHIKGLKELKRVSKKDGYIIILEANRYNPLSYPHMVKMSGHNHWKQSYFKKTINNVFENDYDIEFKAFECHAYPWGLSFWKIYEKMMEKFSPKCFLDYNVAIINGRKL